MSKIHRKGLGSNYNGFMLSLDDLDRLQKHYETISLADLFKGYEGFYYSPPDKALSEMARERFPFLEHIISVGNQIVSGTAGKADLNFLIDCMRYALNKLEEEKELFT